MGLQDPLMNIRVKQEIKDLLTLHATRLGTPVGTMIKGWIMDRYAIERMQEAIKSFGLPEVMRRLTMPSLFMSHRTATESICTGQTLDNFVRQDGELVLQGAGSGGSVLHGKHGKRR